MTIRADVWAILSDAEQKARIKEYDLAQKAKQTTLDNAMKERAVAFETLDAVARI